MKRLQANILFGSQSLGWPGILGLGLLALTAGFYFSTLRPEQAQLSDLRDLAAKSVSRRTPASGSRGSTTVDRLDAFYRTFPRTGHVAVLLGKIYAAADEQALELGQGEYRATRDNVGRLARYQITLPVKGTYPQVRRFLAESLAAVPNLSLDSVQFERHKIAEPIVEAKIKLVMYLGQGS